MTCKIGLGAYHNDDADYESDLQKIFPEKNLHLIDDVLLTLQFQPKLLSIHRRRSLKTEENKA
jgi:hypothetical protein